MEKNVQITVDEDWLRGLYRFSMEAKHGDHKENFQTVLRFRSFCKDYLVLKFKWKAVDFENFNALMGEKQSVSND